MTDLPLTKHTICQELLCLYDIFSNALCNTRSLETRLIKISPIAWFDGSFNSRFDCLIWQNPPCACTNSNMTLQACPVYKNKYLPAQCFAILATSILQRRILTSRILNVDAVLSSYRLFGKYIYSNRYAPKPRSGNLLPSFRLTVGIWDACSVAVAKVLHHLRSKKSQESPWYPVY